MGKGSEQEFSQKMQKTFKHLKSWSTTIYTHQYERRWRLLSFIRLAKMKCFLKTLLVKFWRNIHSHTSLGGNHSRGGRVNIRNVDACEPSTSTLRVQPPNTHTHMRKTPHAKCYSLCIEIAEVRKEPPCPSLWDWFSDSPSVIDG